MKIVVIGAGALGSIIGAHLVHAGEEVIFIARGQRAAFLQQHGIAITGLVDLTVPVTVTTDPHEVQAADVLLVTVKTYDTESALASLRHLQVHSVLSLQNGVLKNEQLARIFGWDHVLGAAAVVSGEMMPDGAIRCVERVGPREIFDIAWETAILAPWIRPIIGFSWAKRAVFFDMAKEKQHYIPGYICFL